MDDTIDLFLAIMRGESLSDTDRARVVGRIPTVEQIREHVVYWAGLNDKIAEATDMADRAAMLVKVAGGMKAKEIGPTDANLELIGKRFPGGRLTDSEKDVLCVMLAEPVLPKTDDIDEADLMPPPIVLANPDPPPPPPPAPPEAVDDDDGLYVDGQDDQDDDQDVPTQPEPTPAPASASARPSRFSNVVDDSVPEAEEPEVTATPAPAAKPPEDDLPDWGQRETKDDSDEADEPAAAPESTVMLDSGPDEDGDRGDEEDEEEDQVDQDDHGLEQWLALRSALDKMLALRDGIPRAQRKEIDDALLLKVRSALVEELCDEFGLDLTAKGRWYVEHRFVGRHLSDKQWFADTYGPFDN